MTTYIINGYRWNYGEWIIDTDSFEKKFKMGNNYGVNNLVKYQLERNIESEAERELQLFKKKNPDVVKGSRGSKLENSSQENGRNNASDIGTGIGSKGSELVKKDLQNNKKENNSLVEKVLPLPKSAQQLVESQLVFDDSIYLDSNTPNLQSDPISLTIIYSLDRNYSEEMNKSEKLKKLHSFQFFLLFVGFYSMN